MVVRQGVRKLLVEVARRRETITYGQVGALTGLPHQGNVLGNILGEISEDEVAHDRPPLSSIVVVGGTIGYASSPMGLPAERFLRCKFVPTDLNDKEQMLRYMREMQEKTWAYWAGLPQDEQTGRVLIKLG
jgi:alkylated DNA nucleotide flippase Atl1